MNTSVRLHGRAAARVTQEGAPVGDHRHARLRQPGVSTARRHAARDATAHGDWSTAGVGEAPAPAKERRGLSKLTNPPHARIVRVCEYSLEAARRRRIDVVICTKLDRLFRSVRHLVPFGPAATLLSAMVAGRLRGPRTEADHPHGILHTVTRCKRVQYSWSA